MKKFFCTILSMLLIITSFSGFGSLYSYAAEDFIPIYTVDDLYDINYNLSGNYKLMCDIDLSEALSETGDYNFGGKGWKPIGDDSYYNASGFTGIFDGNGFSIKGLKIEFNSQSGAKEISYIGLFGLNEGVIKNVRIEDSSIKTGVFQSPSTNYDAYNYIGFIAGYNKGSIMGCINKSDIDYMSGTTSAKKTNRSYVGGISGYNEGIIRESSNEGHLSGIAQAHYYAGGGTSSEYHSILYLAGLTGYNTNGATIETSYNAGSLDAVGTSTDGSYSNIGTAYVAGICNESTGTTQNCYNCGKIFERNIESKYHRLQKAGIINAFGNEAKVKQCYSVCEKLESDAIYYAASVNPVVEQCYYLADSESSVRRGTTPLSLIMMKKELSYDGFDCKNTWFIDPDSDYPYPQLRENRQDNKDIELVAIESVPTKYTYFIGSEIDPTGGKFEVYYKDGSSKVVDMTKTMLSGYDMSKVGIQTVTANYRGFEKTFNITVMKKPNLVSLTLTSQPNTNEFVKGTKFDFTGAQAKAVYDDGTQETIDITPEMTTGGNVNILGDQTISFEHDGETVTFDVKVIPVKVTSIEVASNPTKTTYVEGKAVSTDGLTIKAHYNNGTENLVTGFEVGEIPATVGTHDVEVSFSGCTTTFQIKIVAKTAVSLSIKQDPTKTTYVFGQKFDPTGLVVEATFDNGDVMEVTDYKVGDLPTTTGYSLIPVTYQNTTAYFTVNMKEKAVDSIEVAKLPDKVTYVEGETFTDAGIKVVAKYNDGEEKQVDDYILTNTSTKTVGDKTVTVLYDGLTTTFNIKVIEKTITGLEITPPTKTEYCEGEDFDDEGMVVKAVYDNGKSEEVTDYTMSGFGDADEANVIVVQYKGKAKSFVVNIHKPKKEWTITTPVTCTTDGEKTLLCDTCGNAIKTEVIEHQGHQWGEWVTVTNASCTEKGSKKHTCSICTTTEFSDIDAKNHDFDTEFTVDVKPTCTTPGSKSKHCKNDGCKVTTEVTPIDALGHKDITTLTKATTEEDGSIVTKCDTCKEITSNTVIRKIANVELLNNTGLVYDGTQKKPDVLVTDSVNHELIKGTDYEVSYSDNVQAGSEAKLIVTFKGNYDGKVVKKFTIGALPLDNKAINLSKSAFVYNADVQRPTVSVDGLTQNKDFTVTYSDPSSENAGTYIVTINGEGNYKGIEQLSYKINALDLKNADVKINGTKLSYSGKVLKPTVTVTGLKEETHYSVSYSNANSINPGNYTVTVKGIGNCNGSVSASYSITVPTPVSTSITKLTAVSKGFTVKWTKKSYTGYEIQYSTSSKMTSPKKVSVSSASTTSKKITKLKAKKKYYVQVRTYRTIAGKKYYSAWSAKKYVTTKK